MALTPYPAGRDPAYDAKAAQIDYQRSNAQGDATMRKQMADENYNQALSQLDNQSRTGTKNIDASMQARGVWSSGETSTRQADLQAGVLGGRAAALASKTNVYSQASSDLQRALTSLDLQGQAAVATSLGRGGGGGASAGGYGTGLGGLAGADGAG